MDCRNDEAEFAVLARRSGVALSDDDIAMLYEGYVLLQRTVADLARPADAQTEPALVFVAQGTQPC
jgi:hypothetical protein